MNQNMNDSTYQYAPILIVFGQSNAHGHGTVLPKVDRIVHPLKNVFSLSRDYNQCYGLSDVTWSGYTSFGMNLGESQDHTYCLATESARLWQKEIDNGNQMKLPDLYIIQISIGGQGISYYEKFGNMWYPLREPMMRSGNLEQVNISLFPLALQILSLAIKNLSAKGKRPYILGLHWNQWESEVETGGAAIANAKQNYSTLFHEFRKTIGLSFPIYLYRPLSQAYNSPQAVQEISNLFCEFAKDKKSFQLVDLTTSGLYSPSKPGFGIFQEDGIHYTAKVQQWFASYQLEKLKSTWRKSTNP